MFQFGIEHSEEWTGMTKVSGSWVTRIPTPDQKRSRFIISSWEFMQFWRKPSWFCWDLLNDINMYMYMYIPYLSGAVGFHNGCSGKHILVAGRGVIPQIYISSSCLFLCHADRASNLGSKAPRLVSHYGNRIMYSRYDYSSKHYIINKFCLPCGMSYVYMYFQEQHQHSM